MMITDDEARKAVKTLHDYCTYNVAKVNCENCSVEFWCRTTQKE